MPQHSKPQTRRQVLQAGAARIAAAAAGAAITSQCEAEPAGRVVRNGRIRQSVLDWCFCPPMPLETLARAAADMGIVSIENVKPKDWGILKRYGLICGMGVGHMFVDGLNHKENHAMCLAKLRGAIDAVSAAGFPNVITFSGMRRGMPDDVGLENTVAALKQIISYAERKRVTLCLEMLNSRVDVEMKGHPDYMCDHIEWAAEVCKRVPSERMKILFDIYHVQIMQGDLITRIKQFHPYIGHYHVAGVPGRNEIDGTQEINYPAVMRAIVETGYKGLVGQEFIPNRDPIRSLREAVQICDV
jgi:hydroxypyruvate isomerase